MPPLTDGEVAHLVRTGVGAGLPPATLRAIQGDEARDLAERAVRASVADGDRLFLPRALAVLGQAQLRHDITSGSNGACSAATGWDFTTGWGSYNATTPASRLLG